MSTLLLIGVLTVGVLFNLVCLLNAGQDPLEKFYNKNKQSRKSK